MSRRRWQTLERPELRFWRDFSQDIGELEKRDPGCMPDLTGSSRLLLFSDYGGDIGASPYWWASFLLIDASQVSKWGPKREAWRQAHMAPFGRREMKFSELRDGRRLAALDPFLHCADELDGLLVTIAFSGGLRSVFSAGNKPAMTDEERERHPGWTPRMWERMQRITHFAAVLISGLLLPTQDVLWVTDHDSIVGNDLLGRDAGREWRGCLDRLLGYTPMCHIGHLQGADDPDYLLRDMCAIPDLAGGAVGQVLARRRSIPLLGQDAAAAPDTLVHSIDTEGLSDGVMRLLDWISDRSQTLKRLVCAFEPRPGNATGTVRSWLNIGDLMDPTTTPL